MGGEDAYVAATQPLPPSAIRAVKTRLTTAEGHNQRARPDDSPGGVLMSRFLGWRTFAALVVIVGIAVASYGYYAGRSRVQERGVLDGRHWSLSSSRSWSDLCLEYIVDGRVTTGACGFSKTEPTAAGPGAGSSEVVFGPVPDKAVRVTVERFGGGGAMSVPTRRLRRLFGGRYFLLVVPPRTTAGRVVYVDAAGRALAF